MSDACWRFALGVRGTVFLRVWWQILLMTAYAAIIVYVYDYYALAERDDIPRDLNVFQVLGIVTGMLLVFRTNTAYDRYWEGRKLWSEMVNNIRIITRTVWVMVDDRKDPQLLIGKISLLNLLVGFAYATKHYLREEYSHEEEDLKNFVGHLPQLLTPSSNEPLKEQEHLSMGPTDVVLKRIRSKMSKESRVKMKTKRSEQHKPKYGSQSYIPEHDRVIITATTNIPLEISCFVTSYIMSCKDKNLIDSPTCRILDTAVANMVRCLTGFERIRRTPIPFAYSVHLQQITWIVLLMLPFQWTFHLKWLTVPAMALSSFALLGILGIGREIENPFGYDYNDLNLDDFCKVLHKEVMAIISQPMPKPETWMFSESNCPIVTQPTLSALALTKMSYEEVQMMLFEGKDYKFFPHSKIEDVKSTMSEASKKAENIPIPERKV